MSIQASWAARGATCAVLSTLAFWSGGCGSKSQAAGAQSPPPPSLCAPVRVEKDRRTETQTAVLPAEEYSAMNHRPVGSSTPLPTAPVITAAPIQEPAREAYDSESRAPSNASTGSGSKSEVYVMRQGDTLYAVARKFNVKPKDLIAANSFKDPNHVMAGTKVRIP